MVNWAKRVHAVPTHYFSAGGSIRTAELHQRADRSDKDTSLVYTITVIDLMAKANIAAARGFHFVEAYCVVLVIYIVLCLAIARALRSVERFLRARWQGNVKKSVPRLSFWGRYFEK